MVMHMLARVTFWCCLAGGVASPVDALSDSPPDDTARVREAVRVLAFDPGKYFSSQFTGDPSMIRIAYTGDDWDWPVYSIAISQGCLEHEEWSPACRSRVTARMVRGVSPPNMMRQRERGWHLVHRLIERGATAPESIRLQLGPSLVEWLEADLASCPGIIEFMGGSATLTWVPEEISDPRPRDDFAIWVHADIVTIVFDHSRVEATYEGPLLGGSPSAWAHELAERIEPCWRPAAASPPWSGQSHPP